MAQNKDEIIKDLQELSSRLKKHHDIRAVYLFGSYAKGNPTKYSDVDIAIVLGSYHNGGIFDEKFEIFHMIQSYNSLYETICFDEKEFESDANPIISHIKKNGIRII